MYHQPDVLLFDEATSALDVHTEQQVYDALLGIAEQRTVVTIAHRLETVAKAGVGFARATGPAVTSTHPEVRIPRAPRCTISFQGPNPGRKGVAMVLFTFVIVYSLCATVVLLAVAQGRRRATGGGKPGASAQRGPHHAGGNQHDLVFTPQH
ncbi:MAG: hypothetical protein O3A02_00820 [bacterium]|nr:hypothetical protein [bacterium]